MSDLEFQRLQNENMYLREDNHLLATKIEKLQEWVKTTTRWIEQDLQPLSKVTIEILTKTKQEMDALKTKNKQLQDELNNKNFLLDKALIDVAIAQQQINHLKELGELQQIQIEKIKESIKHEK